MLSLKSFRRITFSNNFIPEIDGLRFIAIITVVFLHANTNFTRVYGDSIPDYYTESFLNFILGRGGMGVNIFFSISGFILGLPFARHYLLGEEKVNVRKYFVRRLTRLEPPYIISLLVLYVVVTLFKQLSFAEYFNNLVASAFYLHWFIYNTWSPINPVTWSLETEVQFYILVPLITAGIFIRRHLKRRIVLISSIIVLDLIMAEYQFELQTAHLVKSIIFYLPNFLTGFLFIDIYLFHLDKIKKSYKWDWVGAIGVVLIYSFNPDMERYWRMFFDMGVLALFMGVFKGKIFNYIFTRDFIVVVGGMCYTLYLLHYPFLYIMTQVISNLHISSFIPNIIVNFAVAIISLLAVSAVFYKLVERPCMDKNWPVKLKEYFKKRLNLANVKS